MQVLDTSVVAKWYFCENDTDKALQLRNTHIKYKKMIVLPDLTLIELANLVWFMNIHSFYGRRLCLAIGLFTVLLFVPTVFAGGFSVGLMNAVKEDSKTLNNKILEYSNSSENNGNNTSNVPVAPGNLHLTVVSTSQINITWTDNSTNEDGFFIERKTGSSGTYNSIGMVSANVITYSNTGLSAGTQYYYRVRAFNTAGNSAYCAETYATTQAFSGPPAGMVAIPAGNFTMGSSSNTNEQPIHSVYLNAYYIDKYEVTNGQYKLFIDSGGYINSSYWTTEGWAWKGSTVTQPSYWVDSTYGYSATNGPNLPVVGVSWYEAYAYAKWAGKRLPTEAEWEKAARGTDQRMYPWSSTWYNNYCNWYDGTSGDGSQDGYSTTALIGSYENGKSPYGCYDMSGNVWEWCNDWYGDTYYSSSPSSNPAGPGTGVTRVLRGGSWSNSVTNCRSADRNTYNPLNRYNNLGFRCTK